MHFLCVTNSSWEFLHLFAVFKYRAPLEKGEMPEATGSRMPGRPHNVPTFLVSHDGTYFRVESQMSAIRASNRESWPSLQNGNSVICQKNESGQMYKERFEIFKKINNRSYTRSHDEMRSYEAYEENQKIVNEHNSYYETGKSSFRLATNTLADMNTDSYLKGYLRLLRSPAISDSDNIADIVGSPLMNNVPESFDWRKKGFITPSYNQQSCGSCYAFSIAQSIEGQVFKRTGKILALSEQQIVDCSISHGNQGCIGGSLRNTLRYLQATGGLMRSLDYKYASKKGECQFVSELAVVNVTSWAILPTKDENAIQAAVAHIGPVAVSINASPKTFQLYSEGIYDDVSCSSTSVNHAMLLIGFDKDFWILKNWWGELWGEAGFMRMRKVR
ncbi:cathepsin L1 isoform X3 [Drosophila novamexicana]|uniref:cathepsin L1 isoform X3 n=1 Tax=Drosophila novamexicana TaxID=47314 RepID=UPI0011E5A2E6|nr:cathepsin L1 isoform X3 [Drosophila novamexicana]